MDKQRDDVINDFSNFIKGEHVCMNIEPNIIWATVYHFIHGDFSFQETTCFYNDNLRILIKPEDKNMLLAKKLINMYAKLHNIRYEDSYEILLDFLNNYKVFNL